jgi:hypothetical protein
MVNIRHVKHKDINKLKWDECIDTAPNGLIYANSFYLDIMSKGWDGLVMNDYEAVMPLTWNKKFGILYLRQPAFTQQLGIFGKRTFNKELTEQFIHKASETFSFAEINLNYANEYPEYSLKKCNLILPLNQPFDELKKSFRNDLIKRSQSAHLIYSSSESVEEAIQLFNHFYSERVPGLKKADYENLLQLCLLLKNKNQLLIRKIKSKDESLLSIALFFKDKKRIYYILSALLPEGRKYDANAFLLHEVIKEFSNQDLLFDFEGSDIPSIHFFFKKYSPVEQPYFFVKINKLPFWKKWIKIVYDHYRQSGLINKE